MLKNKLYLFIIIACLAGFSYLYYNTYQTNTSSLKLCIAKNVTGYPCPSCGTTRAIQLLLKNNWMASLQMNPFGIVVAILMVVLPLWIVFDTITKKETLFKSYKKAEAVIRTKWLAVFLIVLVLLNWIWNIKKGL